MLVYAFVCLSGACKIQVIFCSALDVLFIEIGLAIGVYLSVHVLYYSYTYVFI